MSRPSTNLPCMLLNIIKCKLKEAHKESCALYPVNIGEATRSDFILKIICGLGDDVKLYEWRCQTTIRHLLLVQR